MPQRLPIALLLLLPLLHAPSALAQGANGEASPGIDKIIESWLEPTAKVLTNIIFFSIPVGGNLAIPVVLLILGGTALFLTFHFRFINCRLLGVAFRTVRGRYTRKDDPGQISHFQALATALSATVGLGNIAGVAIAIGLGGPGAVFWMIVMGFLGMTSKFCECTLGVRFRRIDKDGTVHGGGMYYLSAGLRERGFGTLGMVLATLFAIFCIGGALGAGNMFQINQSRELFTYTFGIFEKGGWIFGLVVAVVLGLVIIGGITSIARVTQFLVPFMCVIYLLGAAWVILGHLADVPAAFGIIISNAFSPGAAGGGLLGGIIVGIQRAVFSNEAGVGSAPIAHSAVRTRKPASEGIVALIEPFVDTVIVCTATAMVIILTGFWNIDGRVKDTLEGHAGIGEETVVATLEPGTPVSLSEWYKYQDGAIPNGNQTPNEGWSRTEFEKKDPDATTFHAEPSDEAPEVKIANPLLVEIWTRVTPKGRTESYYVKRLPKQDSPFDSGSDKGIWRTAQGFQDVIGWFPYALCFIALLFAFSTMISWSYYGEQAVGFLCGNNPSVTLAYRIVFCLAVILGSAAKLDSVLDISDALYFGMVVPNLIGVYLLLPVVRKELASYIKHTGDTDAGKTGAE